MKKFIAFIGLFVCLFAIGVSASNKISPAIDVIAYENGMIKSGVIYNREIVFDTNDFDDSLGMNVKYITVCTLPDENEGRLMLGSVYIVENQIIYREDFSMIKFVSKADIESDSSFVFEPNSSGYEIVCSLRALKNVNLSPFSANDETIPVWTQENVSCFGSLSGYDPEGDELRFEIVSYPENGLLTITNSATGDYKYTPYMSSVGKDEFTYRVRDCYGNYSSPTSVSITINKPRVSYVFNDMNDSRYINAASVMIECSYMECVKNEDGTISFNPKKSVTKEEFIYYVMNAMGAKNVPIIKKTRFADDDKISPQYKGYIEGAFALGVISGEILPDGVYINPKKEITLAEVAVIIDKILGVSKNGMLPTFADDEDIPNWARESILSLCQLGILPKTDGKIYPNEPVTREQAAHILAALLDYCGKLKQ